MRFIVAVTFILLAAATAEAEVLIVADEFPTMEAVAARLKRRIWSRMQ